jgi:S-(hydroxymethyl)glutathione dehydrogenase/alcohol dehydrogenase
VRLADGDLGEGRWPIVLGHEGAGVVEAVGDGVTHVGPGDPVGFCIVPSCRECHECRAGRLNLCIPAGERGPAGTLMDGTSRLSLPDGTPLQHALMTACFADRVVVTAAGAVPLPRELPLWQAAVLGCGVVTGFGAVRNAARVQSGESAAVIGCGGVGLQVIAALRLAGAEPIVAIDRVQDKLDPALERGATHAVDAGLDDPLTAVHAATGRGVDHAFEVVGRAETMRLAWDVLRPGATAIVVGLAPRGVDVSLPAIEFLSDKGIRGTFYGNGDAMTDIPALAALAVRGELDLASVVTEIDVLDGVEAALDRLRRGEGARTVLVVDADLAGHPGGR